MSSDLETVIKGIDQIEKQFSDAIDCIMENDPNPMIALSIEKVHLDFYCDLIRKIKTAKKRTLKDAVTLALISKDITSRSLRLKKRYS
jgi:hypothetical protein